MAMLGLRGKSLLALLFLCALALIPAGLAGWYSFQSVRDHFGMAYASNQTLLNQQRMLTPISRELALARRLAASPLLLDWMRAPNDRAARARFLGEAEGYRQDFRDRSYFLVDSQLDYYYSDDKEPGRATPRYRLLRDRPADAWFFSTMQDPAPYDLQVDLNHSLGITKVWFNVQVRDGDRPIGLIGTGLVLSSFLDEFVRQAAPGVTQFTFDAQGGIQAHPDASRIAYKSAADAAEARHTVYSMIDPEQDGAALRAAMAQAQAAPGSPVDLRVRLDGKPQLLVLSYLPELKWFVATAVDLGVARIVDLRRLTPALIAIPLLLLALLAGFGYAVERIVLRPLRQLQQSAQAISAGQFDAPLPVSARDEIGELSRAFDAMADKIRTHTAELEARVRERTVELEQANLAMAATHKKIDDSIDYASLIQRAILPNRQMIQSLGLHHFVLWRPRDVVGGDFYVFRADGDNCLLGVVDCAGHGVPGALMTMLARAAIDHAISECGPRDPAAILRHTDAAMRAMLQDAELERALATNMDAGLVYVDRAAGTLRFAGAKISLYASDGQQVEEVKGARRALGEKRSAVFENQQLPLAGRTFYLVTDGILDQAGGKHGFGFGSRRLADLLLSVADLPLANQSAAINQTLVDYQGRQPQRDDITILSFRFD